MNPVVLIHGLGDTGKLFRWMRARLEAGGWTVHSVNLVPNNGDAGLDVLAAQLAAYVEDVEGSAPYVDLVGFSMGGLVARYYVQRLGGCARVERLITLGAPHHGTWLACLRHNPGTRQMRPGSALLRALNADAEAWKQVAFTSIWTPFDLMILPPTSSFMPDARSIAVPVAAHPWMVRNERVLRAVIEALMRPGLSNSSGGADSSPASRARSDRRTAPD